ncbi:MAG: hypothetical protein IKR39_01830 [Lachnospiraceae bacterium]|nr:hypothetical protein [Lachnospiraceae bacterium]
MKKYLYVIVGLSLILSGCGMSKSEEHVHKYMPNVIVEASCGVAGVIDYVCECGDHFISNTAAKIHKYGEYVSDKNATADKDGTETATCSICGDKITRKEVGSRLTYSSEH